MKRLSALLILCAVIFMFFACSEDGTKPSSVSRPTSMDAQLIRVGGGSGWPREVPEMSLSGLKIIASENADFGRVYVLGDFSVAGDNDKNAHRSYLAVETPKSKVVLPLAIRNYEGAEAYFSTDNLSLCDVNGDQSPDIVVLQTAGAEWGVRVFSLEMNEGEIGLLRLFTSEAEGCLLEDDDGSVFTAYFDTGFRGKKDGNTLTVKNKNSGLTMNFDISGADDLYLESESIIAGSISGSKPTDSDNDGVFVIECTQDIYYESRATLLGTAGFTLYWNEDAGGMTLSGISLLPSGNFPVAVASS